MQAPSSIAVLLLLCVYSIEAPIAHADLIVESFQDVIWDRTNKPSGPAPITFGLAADANASTNQINAFSIGIRIVPKAGASGSFEIKSVSLPDTNPIFPIYTPVLQKLNGGLQTISGDNAIFANVTIPVSGSNLFQAQLYSPGNDASGLFEIYADYETTNYFTTTEFDGLKFANIPGSGIAPGVLLGAVEITITAVPEPSCITLAGISLVALMAARRRRKLFNLNI